jgi:hypothetical protein
MRAAPFILMTSLAASGQWLNLQTPGLPRLPDGKPDLAAPTPKTFDGKPDLSGIWRSDPTEGVNYIQNVARDLQPGEVRPWAAALSKQRAWLDANGHPHSESLSLTERFRRVDLGHLEIQITIDDPKAFTKPFTVVKHPQLRADYEMLEYFCGENERDSRHMVGK